MNIRGSFRGENDLSADRTYCADTKNSLIFRVPFSPSPQPTPIKGEGVLSFKVSCKRKRQNGYPNTLHGRSQCYLCMRQIATPDDKHLFVAIIFKSALLTIALQRNAMLRIKRLLRIINPAGTPQETPSFRKPVRLVSL